jgi:hypothetical protein
MALSLQLLLPSTWKTGSPVFVEFAFMENMDKVTNNALWASTGLRAGLTARIHDPRPEPAKDESETTFPLVHIWSGEFETFIDGPKYGVRGKTRLLIFTKNADDAVASRDCGHYTGFIASWMQQEQPAYLTAHYANHGLVAAEAYPTEKLPDGSYRGHVDILWGHTE